MTERLETGCSKVPAIWIPLYFAVFACVMIGFSVKFAIDELWVGSAIVLIFAAFVGCLAYWMLSQRATMKKYRLVIDPEVEKIEFHFFTFVSQFLPEPPRRKVELGFREIISLKRQQGRGGHDDYEVRTTEGKVILPSFMDDMPTVLEVLNLILEKNKLTPGIRESALSEEPKIKTPWYGWALLVGGIGVIAFIGWKALYNS